MKNLEKTFIYISFFLTLNACHNDDDTSIEDFDIVKTQHSQGFWDNNSPTTYHLLDEVRWIEQDSGQGNINPTITRDYDQAILSSINKNMTSLGYTKVDSLDVNNLPDIIIRSNALATTYSQIDLIYNSWYNWWGFYDPYYPDSFYPIYYEWNEGTIIIEMGDANSLDIQKKEIDIVWIAGINGLVRGTQSGNIDFIESRINDAFKQSFYLSN
ncbi:DUF4136 domain-containing protein [Aquimarina sediminis]|uniref:DUF4136 domain-containing protein n=1 Tax=Aquimarina sediminis TaxID=2070536 RepID=UPI000CA0474B|nr:DUF4136 domain-containing protein [Aquimarina sediminis]